MILQIIAVIVALGLFWFAFTCFALVIALEFWQLVLDKNKQAYINSSRQLSHAKKSVKYFVFFFILVFGSGLGFLGYKVLGVALN